MRTLFIAAIAFAVSVSPARAQGVFINSNRDLPRGIDAPVFESDGTTPLDSRYVAQVWAGANVDSMVPISGVTPFRDGEGVGYWKAPIPELVDGIAVPGVAEGEFAYVQVLAWNAAYGGLEPAIAAGGENSWGASAIFSAATGRPIDLTPPIIHAFPTALVGLSSFSLGTTPTLTALSSLESMPANLAAIISANAVIPEPATIALGLIGTLGLSIKLRRRETSR